MAKKHKQKHKRKDATCSTPPAAGANMDYLASPVNQAQLLQMTRSRLVSEGREAMRNAFAALTVAQEKIDLLQYS